MEKCSSVLIFLLLGIHLPPGYGDEGYFWHITDFHWDFTYWNRQLSCHGKNIPNPGKFGDSWCDSPWNLINESVHAMKRVPTVPDFIFWTGDSPPHVALDELSVETNEELVRNITNLLQEVFPDTPVYATYGNHDYYEKDQFPPHGNEIYNNTLLIWKTWINDASQDANFRKGGYYTVKTRTGLRILALNSNLYYNSNRQTNNVTDPADQFKWMDDVLSSAKQNNEKVIITGHVPPGFTAPRNVRWMKPQFNKKLNELVLKHSDVIVGMHFGHEHHDNFRMFYNSSGHAVVVMFLAPSVTPWRYVIGDEVEPIHNPGARLVKYDRQNGRQLDIIQYYIDLPQANSNGTLDWILGYNATVDYSISDLQPNSIDALVTRMNDRQSSEFKQFVNWYNVNARPVFDCDDTCHKSVICGLKNILEDSFKKCLLPSPTGGNGTIFRLWEFGVVYICTILLVHIFKNIQA